MKVKPLMSTKPFLHLLVFMGTVVIQNQMQLLIWHILVQSSEKLDSLVKRPVADIPRRCYGEVGR